MATGNRAVRLMVLLVPAVASWLSSPCVAEPPSALRVYVGTYSGKESKGIYMLRLDLDKGTLGEPELAAETRNPTFLALHPGGRFLYAVGEIGDFGGKKAGAVSAFAIEPSGKLTLLNQQPSGGPGPCHVTVDREGRNVLAANYGGGSVCVIPIAEDGKLKEPTCVIQHEGKGANPRRQAGPHAHSINLDAAGRFAFAADLGLDKVLVYRFDPAAGKLAPNDPPAAQVSPGAGPRHFAFHPGGKFAYVINELSSTITAFSYDAAAGRLDTVQTVPTLPGAVLARGMAGNSTAEVQVHPSGQFVYGSNRGHDSIAIFAVDQASGKLKTIGHESTQGKTPRNFGIDPSGRYLLAANQGTNNLVLFRIDAATGKLTATGSTATVGAPVCVKFAEIR